jgi:hypothetical protein
LFLEAKLEPEKNVRDVATNLEKRLFNPKALKRMTFPEGNYPLTV